MNDVVGRRNIRWQKSISVRTLKDGEARRYLEVIRQSVRGIAAFDYDPAVVEAWAPWPVTNEEVQQTLANPEQEARIAATWGDDILGVGAVIPQANELRACYVLPQAARKSVGRAIVNELESIARAADCPRLNLTSSLTAQPFYQAIGYRVVKDTIHVLSSGTAMAAIRMQKLLH